MFALGALLFLLGLRFAMLRWRELAIAEKRIQAAVTDAEREVRRGVNELRQQDGSHASGELATALEADETRIVQARSDPPGPLL